MVHLGSLVAHATTFNGVTAVKTIRQPRSNRRGRLLRSACVMIAANRD